MNHQNGEGRVAKLYYGPNGFRKIAAGDHVLCAVTGQRILLDDLRYWSVDRQEAYAGAAEANQAELAARGRG